MEDKFGFRTFGFQTPKPFGSLEENRKEEAAAETIQKITPRPNSFSFNIQKFLNIKQEEIVEDEVQEYKVTTSQNDKDRELEDEKMDEMEEEDDKSGVVVDDQDDAEPNYRSLLLNSYPFPTRKDSNDEDSMWSRKLPRQKNAGDRLLDIPCKVCGDRSSGKHYGIYSCDGELRARITYINVNPGIMLKLN